MNQDQWNQKKTVIDSAPADCFERFDPCVAGDMTRTMPPSREVVAAIKRTTVFEHANDAEWNQWRP